MAQTDTFKILNVKFWHHWCSIPAKNVDSESNYKENISQIQTGIFCKPNGLDTPKCQCQKKKKSWETVLDIKED